MNTDNIFQVLLLQYKMQWKRSKTNHSTIPFACVFECVYAICIKKYSKIGKFTEATKWMRWSMNNVKLKKMEKEKPFTDDWPKKEKFFMQSKCQSNQILYAYMLSYDDEIDRNKKQSMEWNKILLVLLKHSMKHFRHKLLKFKILKWNILLSKVHILSTFKLLHLLYHISYFIYIYFILIYCWF